jgi:hypothetical protein
MRFSHRVAGPRASARTFRRMLLRASPSSLSQPPSHGLPEFNFSTVHVLAKCEDWQYNCTLGFKTHFKIVDILGIRTGTSCTRAFNLKFGPGPVDSPGRARAPQPGAADPPPSDPGPGPGPGPGAASPGRAPTRRVQRRGGPPGRSGAQAAHRTRNFELGARSGHPSRWGPGQCCQ